MADVIRCINEQRENNHKFVVAVDLPSGLDCDTGTPADFAVEADVTVTFVAKKIGFRNPKAAKHLGRVIVGSIGAPQELVNAV
jgi:NAD(P)H-hydrate epimerase